MKGRFEGGKGYRISGARVADRKDLRRRQLLPETLLVAKKERETAPWLLPFFSPLIFHRVVHWLILAGTYHLRESLKLEGSRLWLALQGRRMDQGQTGPVLRLSQVHSAKANV